MAKIGLRKIYERQHGSRHLDFELWALLINLYLLDTSKNSAKNRALAEIRESDETLLMSLEVITKRIREQMLIDFEEFMLPQARENLQKFWAGANGSGG